MNVKSPWFSSAYSALMAPEPFTRWRASLRAHPKLVSMLIVALVLAIAASAYGAWHWSLLFGAARAAPTIVVSGNIEAHESVLSVTQVQAPIVYLPFDEGARVTRGTVLARLDDRLYRRQVDIDRANLEVKRGGIFLSSDAR